MTDNGTQPESLLKLVSERLGEMLNDSDPLIGRYTREISKGQGKMLRPMLMIAISEFFGGAKAKPLVNSAACCELLHTATLIHDDVIDESDTRRGNATLNNRYGNEIAVIVGDYVLAVVIKSLSEERDFRLVDMLLDTSQELGRGVLEEILNRNNFKLGVEKYKQVIFLKTAVLFKLCCLMGAYLGGADEDGIKLGGDYGRQLGMAFQIVDDLLDVTADESITGKPSFNDLAEGRITLPFILALEQDPSGTRELVEVCQENPSSKIQNQIRLHLAGTGSLAQSRKIAIEYLLEARKTAKLMIERGYGMDDSSLKKLEEKVIYAIPAPVFELSR